LFPENYAFYPRTWCLPAELAELKLAQTQSEGRLRSIKHSPGFAMIVKPDHMSQGKGIYLTGDVDKIDTNQLCVAQEYLNTPYLLNGMKFDMRVYVLVLSCDPLRIYIHKEGLVRFCTQAYVPVDLGNPKTMENLYMHLTNYSLNKENEAFL
jgi:tubulin polyglutamylase TTLL6/13